MTESKLAASLDHPNVLPIHAAGEHEGVLYIAMRLVPGADLRETLRQDGPLEPERAARIVAQVASALDAAHAHGLVHRDVKPANVLVTPEGHAYLTDFGLTKQLAQRPGGDADRDGAGDAGLRRARADPRRGDRAVHRRLLARLHAHAPADRRGAVHGADRGGEAVGALLRAAAEAERAHARARHALRRDRRAGDEQAPVGPLRDRGRAGRRGARRRLRARRRGRRRRASAATRSSPRSPTRSTSSCSARCWSPERCWGPSA